MEKYFIIRNCEGDTTVKCVTKDALLERINDGEFQDVFNAESYNNMPHSDTNYWGYSTLIIKGEIVSPEAKTKITEYVIK
jgi:hypothetical protein